MGKKSKTEHVYIAKIVGSNLCIYTKTERCVYRKTSNLPLDFFPKRGMLIAAIPSEKEAIRMFKWFQSLVSVHYQELSRMQRELRREANQ